LEKAYDTSWKYGILKDLHDAGLRGQLLLFISGFLSDRKFQDRVGGTYSRVCEQEMGVPQGSILSVTFSCLKINSVVKALCPGVDCSLYVDDFNMNKTKVVISGERQKVRQKAVRWPCGVCSKGVGSNSLQCTSCQKLITRNAVV